MFGQVKGQEQDRRPETFIDQHGRAYFANVELKTGDPCEVLQPQGWTAPRGPEWFKSMLMPPLDDMKVVRMVPRLERAKRRYQVFIDYTAWLNKIDVRDEEWTLKLFEGAKALAGSVNAALIAENPPPLLLSELGARAFPPRLFVEAMAAGNKWALGLSDVIPEKAKALLAELEPSITRKRRRERSGEIIDPFADENVLEDDGFDVASEIDPFSEEAEAALEIPDELFDLEEQLDPDATGGKTVQVGAGAATKTAKSGRKKAR